MLLLNKKLQRYLTAAFSICTIVGGVALLVYMQRFTRNKDKTYSGELFRTLVVYVLGTLFILFGLLQLLPVLFSDQHFTLFVLFPLVI